MLERDGVSATRPPIGESTNGAAGDSRINRLYADERIPLGPRDAWHLLRRSWRFITPHRRLVAIKFTLAIFSLVLILMTPWPVKIVIDNVIDAQPLTGFPARILMPLTGGAPSAILSAVAIFLAAAAILIGLVADAATGLDTGVESGGLDQTGSMLNESNNGWSLWNGLFGYLETAVTIDLTQRINQTLRTTIYERFLRSPIGLYSDQKVGDAVFRVMNDSAAIGSVLYDGVIAPIMSIVMFALALAVLWVQFAKEPMIPLVAALLLPAVAIGSGLFGRVIREQSQSMRERGSDVMAAFEERLAQVQLIKAFGQEKRESERIDAASWESYRSTLKMIVIAMAVFFVLTPIVGFLVIAAIYHLMLEVLAKRITLGDVVLLIGYGSMLAQPMMRIGSTWAQIQAPVAGLRRIHSVLDRLAEDDTTGNGANGGEHIHKIEFRDVAVGYASAEPVIEHVTMTLAAGEMVAIAGSSGAGKTTLILSIPRFLEPASGAILIDGIDSRMIPANTIRNRIGFVFQQEALFSATLAENIAYGRPDATDAEIRAAATSAGATEFIERLAEGYATVLGRRGARLSVGQKQRIAIARALLRNPDVLILDEPTAPLDPANERGLIATLRALAASRIVLIVAHRAGTLAACDRVIFVSNGAISATGTHDELLATNPAYREYLAVTQSELQG